MTPFVENLSVDSIWVVLKWLYVLGFMLYTIFALVVVSQVRQMTHTLNGSIDSMISLLAFVHLMVAIGALFLAFVIL